MTTQHMDFDTGVASRRTDRPAGRTTFTETKAGFKTTEFLLTLAAIVAILVAVYVGDADLDRDRWLALRLMGCGCLHREPWLGQARHP